MHISATNNQLSMAMNDWNVTDPYKSMGLEEIRNIQKECCLPYSVAAFNLSGGLNLGNMIRTAVIFGVKKFYVVGKKRYDRRSTVGAHNYIDIEFIEKDIHDDQEYILDKISEEYRPTIIEHGGVDIDSENFFYKEPRCFIFGEESIGIPDSFTKLATSSYRAEVMSIDQIGVLRSLNVSSAAAIVMYKVAMELREPRSWK